MLPYSPLAVANWFLRRAEMDGITLDPLKLIKLVYLAHGWHLAVTGRPLINETVEAWPYGPVVPTVYHAFKRYGRGPVSQWAFEVTEDGGFDAPIVPRADDELVELLERVWQVYKGYSGIQLSNLTHAPDSPWSEVRKSAARQGKVRGVDIPDDLIRRHFYQQATQRSSVAAP